MTSSKLGYLNSKQMLRWDSHFKNGKLSNIIIWAFRIGAFMFHFFTLHYIAFYATIFSYNKQASVNLINSFFLKHSVKYILVKIKSPNIAMGKQMRRLQHCMQGVVSNVT